jgi:S-adenosylmethionine synthetase
MIWISEMVLPGHPDKFCDQIADAVIAECVKIDEDAYGQVEVAIWSDQVWISGGICTRRPFEKPLRDIVVETGLAIGYGPGNHIDANRYQVTSTLCMDVGDPSRYTSHVNDQAITIGWAGYDAKTRYLPPEHFLAHWFADALFRSCREGVLAGHGPDGKLMVRIREEGDRWTLEHLLITLQQKTDASFMDFCQAVTQVAGDTYAKLREFDSRWCVDWSTVEVMVNPNGPLINGGSDGDNGQTGRKLVMDFYGPRIPIGGGALSGKHMSHIDRNGAYAARAAALEAVVSGARECLVRLAWAPNVSIPIDVDYRMEGRGRQAPPEHIHHDLLRSRFPARLISSRMGRGKHFYCEEHPWNVSTGRQRIGGLNADPGDTLNGAECNQRNLG